MEDNVRRYLEAVSEFHGHVCPGLAIGVKATLLAIKEIDAIIGENADEDIVCLAETDACGVDAPQILLGTTAGNGGLRIVNGGKHAFSFYNRNNGKSVRIFFSGIEEELSKEAKIELILSSKGDSLFQISSTIASFPQRAQIYKSIKCSLCGELTAENYIKYTNNKPICSDCCEKDTM